MSYLRMKVVNSTPLATMTMQVSRDGQTWHDEGAAVHFQVGDLKVRKPVSRWRQWLGYKLLAAGYWLLGGHA